MISDIDIWRAANLMVKRHGKNAPIRANEQTDEMLKSGDRDGKAIWLRIVQACEELLRSERRDGEALN